MNNTFVLTNAFAEYFGSSVAFQNNKIIELLNVVEIKINRVVLFQHSHCDRVPL